MRLGLGFVAAARRREQRADAAGLQRAVQAAARLAGGDRQAMAAFAQVPEQLGNPFEQGQRVLALKEVAPVQREEILVTLGRQARR